MSNTPVLPVPTDKTVREWITKQMQIKENKQTWLLAFADDGIIWGRMDGGKLVVAHEASQKEDKKNYAQLRGETLQQAHIFGDKVEIRLFRDENNRWQAVKIEDEGDVINESQILWGDQLAEEDQPLDENFTRLKAERKGIPPQILPIERKKYANIGKYVRLEVHHMVNFNEDGEAYIKLSRLAGLRVEEKEA